MRAFTLMELMLALLIAGLLAGVVSLSLASPVRAAGFEDAVEQVIGIDRHVRQRAIATGRPSQMLFQLHRDQIACVDPDMQLAQRPPFNLPAGCRLVWVATAHDLTHGGLRGIAGDATIHCSSLGMTPSYAFELAGAEDQRAFVLICGLTGDAIRLESEQDVEKLLRLPQEARDDAD